MEKYRGMDIQLHILNQGTRQRHASATLGLGESPGGFVILRVSLDVVTEKICPSLSGIEA
jgi:hypothetical protein